MNLKSIHKNLKNQSCFRVNNRHSRILRTDAARRVQDGAAEDGRDAPDGHQVGNEPGSHQLQPQGSSQRLHPQLHRTTLFLRLRRSTSRQSSKAPSIYFSNFCILINYFKFETFSLKFTIIINLQLIKIHLKKKI